MNIFLIEIGDSLKWYNRMIRKYKRVLILLLYADPYCTVENQSECILFYTFDLSFRLSVTVYHIDILIFGCIGIFRFFFDD